MRVLIAEDDPVSRRLLERIVQGFGHQATSTADGEEAWERFQTGDFRFVLTDWMMPGLDGLELCRRIRASVHSDYVYIIVVTSSGGPEDLITGMNAGADDFVTKPVKPMELQVRMRAAERVLKLHQQLQSKNHELETANVRLRRLSRLDALMEIGNRLAFDEAAAEFHDRAVRYRSPYGVVMCDVDFFKSYNDHHGHWAGDQVLKQVAAVIRDCLRASDGAFRYGGEEIVVLLAEQTAAEAAITGERLRATVESLRLSRPDLAAGAFLTISCGVAACPIDQEPLPGWEVVLGWADQALYRAKAGGRNRVEAAEVGLEVSV